MSARFSCPHCQHVLATKSVKVGRFKPTCTSCQTVFVLEVYSVNPLKLKTARLPPPTATDQTVDQLGSDADTQLASGAESSRRVITGTQAAAEDATMEHVAPAGLTATAPSGGETALNISPTSSATAPFQRGPAATRPSNSTASAGGVSVDATADFQRDATRPAAREQTPSAVPQERLGGYRILRELGRGGMGAVYLARQLSLDRNVALKTIQAEWARNPRIIARFIREAYAAAQLTHHNVVQIYDLGEDTGTNFFSMELVPGGSLDDLLKQQGRMNARMAAAYILQAARGLKFAHDHGMVHRDIKPANLMLTPDGLVKVADLGLVKTAGAAEDSPADLEDRNVMLASARAQVTGHGAAMGTPAYMAPEQADDAAGVDHRADIYSLGCTFYALLTGHPPFAGQTAIEVITKHKSEPLTRPDHVVQDIPGTVGSIVEKMMAKRPENRYQDLSQTIADLEHFLSSDNPQAAVPSADHAARARAACDEFNAVPRARLRAWLPMGLAASSLVLAAILLMVNLRFASSVLLAALLTPIATLGLAGLRRGRSPIGSRCRALLWESRPRDWLLWGIGALLLLCIAWGLGLMPYAIATALIAVGCGWAYHRIVLRPLAAERQASVAAGEGLLRELRAAGLSETRVQQFMADSAGPRWEEFLENLFDYDARRRLQRTLDELGRVRGGKRFQPWRDAIVDQLDARLDAQRRAKEQRLLAKVERASLKAAGLSDTDAQEQADALAATLVTVASEARQSMQAELALDPSSQHAAAKRAQIKRMLAEARLGKPASSASFARRTTASLVAHFFGAKYRFLLGAALLAGCALWASENHLLDPDRLDKLRQTAEQGLSQASEAAKSQDLETVQDASAAALAASTASLGQTRPLSYLPWFDGLGEGFVGLLIVASALLAGWRYSIFATSAAAIVLLGNNLGLPELGPFSAAATSTVIALAILAVGLLLGRHRHGA